MCTVQIPLCLNDGCIVASMALSVEHGGTFKMWLRGAISTHNLCENDILITLPSVNHWHFTLRAVRSDRFFFAVCETSK